MSRGIGAADLSLRLVPTRIFHGQGFWGVPLMLGNVHVSPLNMISCSQGQGQANARSSWRDRSCNCRFQCRVL